MNKFRTFPRWFGLFLDLVKQDPQSSQKYVPEKPLSQTTYVQFCLIYFLITFMETV